MQAPGAPDKDREGGFVHGGWLVPFADDDFVNSMTAWGAQLDRPAGRVRCRAQHHRPKHVASRTLTAVEWHTSSLLQGDVPAVVSALKKTTAARSRCMAVAICCRPSWLTTL